MVTESLLFSQIRKLNFSISNQSSAIKLIMCTKFDVLFLAEGDCSGKARTNGKDSRVRLRTNLSITCCAIKVKQIM